MDRLTCPVAVPRPAGAGAANRSVSGSARGTGTTARNRSVAGSGGYGIGCLPGLARSGSGRDDMTISDAWGARDIG
ncbi:hypothetical protein GCM10023175_20950 [Pseudonocardia xishanensis]|uniref:Uncharacterized protein n=1 Tax=Pseudonocardia xishanensis TaxID=630995 RepID=A0ABP8RNQ6_9PSEU